MSNPSLTLTGISAQRMKLLQEHLHHWNVPQVTTNDLGVVQVQSEDLRLNFTYDEKNEALSLELIQMPGLVTPGYVLGRIYDEILNLPHA